MPRSIPRIWAVVLVAVVVIAAGGVFFALGRDKKEETPLPVKAESSKIGVINMEKAIASHPRHAAWVAVKQEEESLMGSFKNNEKLLAGRGKNETSAMHESMDAVFEQEFNAKMKAKQDELNEKMSEKMQIISNPLNSELQDYIQQVEAEYQPQLFDLNLKLRVLQMEEPQAKDILAKIETLKQEQSVKVEAKNRELSQKMDEMMAPEMKKFDEEMSRHASELNAELSAKMAGAARGLPPLGPEYDMPPELKELEEKIVAKKQEAAAIYESIGKDVRYKTIDIAVKHGLEAVIGDFMVNFGAFDITDLVIAEFKK